jgi:hypothetical protein
MNTQAMIFKDYVCSPLPPSPPVSEFELKGLLKFNGQVWSVEKSELTECKVSQSQVVLSKEQYESLKSDLNKIDIGLIFVIFFCVLILIFKR